ncbi:MAG: hypothetical protein Q8M92_01720 [Candidatus Subteraquimicrobiales bacterium]|nr:hypothetical protein [Candidatus Subteraquimicrobiales bacterium]
MSLNIEIENVGGFMHTKIIPGLERGLNRVRAPNATGKTSLIKGIELLILSEDELRGKGHYSNLFVGAEEPIRIKLTGDIEHERIFRRIGEKDLREIGTLPLVTAGGRRASVCFAVPENPIMAKLLEGKSVKDYVELLAGSDRYEKAQAALQEISSETFTKLEHYRDLLIRLEELQKQKGEGEKEIEKYRKEFIKMPVLDERGIFKDFGEWNKKKQHLRNIDENIADANSRIRELENLVESLKDSVKKYESQIQLLRKKYPRIEARRVELSKELHLKQNDLGKIKVDKARTQEMLSLAQRLEHDVKQYKEEGLCFACGRKLTKDELQDWNNKLRTDLKNVSSLETKIAREIEDLKKEKSELEESEQALGKYETELKQDVNSLSARESDKKTLHRTMDDLQKKRENTYNEIQKLSTSKEAYREFKEREEKKIAIDQKEADIKRIDERIEEFKKQTLGVEKLHDKYEFIQVVTNHLEARKNQIVEEIRETFSKRVTELYKKLGYRDFDNIEIGPDFKVSVTREKGGKIVENFPLDALSTSERVTIAIAFLLSAKNEYVRDFPFFILDELITSYDPERFKIMKNYLKESEDYVLVTELASDIKELEVVREA